MIAKVWTGFMLLVLAGLLAALAVAFARERGWHPLRELSAFVRRQSFFELLLLLTFIGGMWAFASTKHGDSGDGGTNNVPRGAVVELASRGDAESQGRGTSDAARALWQSGIGRDLRDFVSLCETNRSARTLTDDDFERGFVTARVGTNEVFEFWAPDNAIVCDDWRSFGAATDWMYVAVTNWLFLVGTNEVDTLRVHSFGKVIPKILESDGTISTNRWIAPFAATLGIVPEANWSQMEDYPSLFWHCVTPSNTLQMTWQNVLLNRDAMRPMSFQAEFWPSGRFMYRYDLSRLGVEEVSNVVVGAALGGDAWGADAIPTNVTSLAFYPVSYDDTTNPDRDNDGVTTEDELFVYGTDPDDEDSDHDGLTDGEEILTYNADPLNPHSINPNVCDGVAVNAGGEDLFSYPEGSTNTVLEHLFYSGTTNGTFTLPQSSDGYAVLGVTASGYGSGELIIDGKVVPLVGRPQMRGGNERGMKGATRGANDSPTLSVRLKKGERHTLVLQGDNQPAVDLYSNDFGIGLSPSLLEPGWICFPITVASPACIHDFYTKTRRVRVFPGSGASGLVCTWSGGADVEITRVSNLSADVKAEFHPRNERTITYTLSHPDYLFGKKTYSQKVRFCPKPQEPSDPDDPDEDPDWFDYCGGEISVEPSWYDPEHEPQADPEGDEEEDPVETCPEHHVPYEVCESLHRTAYTNAVATLPHRSKVLLIRDEPVYEPITIQVAPGIHNCCPCPEHWTNYVGVTYASDRLSVVGEDGLPFRMTEESCTIYVAGVTPSDNYGDARLVLNRNGIVDLQYDMTVFGVAIEDVSSSLGASYSDLGLVMETTTNVWQGASMSLVTKVGLPDGYVHVELADVSGEFAVWCLNPNTYECVKLVDSEMSPMVEIPMSAWRIFAGETTPTRIPTVWAYVTSSSPGRATLRFRYWNIEGGELMEDVAEQRFTSVSAPRITMPSVIGVNDDDDNYNNAADWRDKRQVFSDDDLVEVDVSVGLPFGVVGVVEVMPEMTAGEMWRDRARTQSVGSQGDAFVVSASVTNRKYYVEGTYWSQHYQDERISAEFSFGDVSLSSSRDFTFVERIAEPINTNRTASGQIVNPCCAILGASTPMRVSVLPEDFPDAKIHWKVVSGSGSFSDSTGRDATFVASGSENSDAVVQVDFGDCPGDAPQFKLRATTMREVKIYPCIISRADAPPPVDLSQITNMINEVNVIYRQVGMHFSLGAPPTNIVNGTWSQFAMREENADMRVAIRNVLHDTDGIEVYFIEGTGSEGTVGIWNRYGIILRKQANAKVLAHEIGHACNLLDIFYMTGNISGDTCTELGKNVSESSLNSDWNNGTGCRFYPLGLKQHQVIPRLLMYGVESATSCDMPAGSVFGKPENGNPEDVPVGRSVMILDPRSL